MRGRLGEEDRNTEIEIERKGEEERDKGRGRDKSTVSLYLVKLLVRFMI